MSVPVGVPEKVRVAMARLVDPQQRLVYELWARIPAGAALRPVAVSEDGATGWKGGRRALGWGP